MPYLLNALYLAAFVMLSPWLLYKAITTGKYRHGWLTKFLGLVPARVTTKPCVWFHGVSVGEVHLLRQVIAAFRAAHPQYEVVISTTTDTGLEEARKHFTDLSVFYWPFDFTWAVRRALSRIQPELVVLAESELWPNFLRLAKAAGVKTAVINGRMSPRSLKRSHRFAFLLRPTFARVDLWAMQSVAFADNLHRLLQENAGDANIYVTGNVKYDGVQTKRDNPKTQTLRELFAVPADELVLVAGSTQAPEEELLLKMWPRLKNDFPALRLLIVPRQRERFEEVARLLQNLGISHARRSRVTEPCHAPVILIDTMGELSAIWGLADVAFVGGSLDGKRGGQNMIEPAAYGAAVCFGPHVWNFRPTVEQLLARQGALPMADADDMEAVLRQLLLDGNIRRDMGQRARQFVQSQQGATQQTVRLVGELLTSAHPTSIAA